MKYWTRCAFIIDNTAIKIGWFSSGGYQTATRLAKEVYDSNCFVVLIADDSLIKEGDKYHNGAFWKTNDDGTETQVGEALNVADIESAVPANTSKEITVIYSDEIKPRDEDLQ
jgi:hypothetical protein